MRVLIVGANGRLGTALSQALRERHDVITAARSGGDVIVDMTDPASVAAMYEAAGPLDAVACAAGEAPWKDFATLTEDDLAASVRSKLLGQVDIVRQGVHHVSDGGSFTLITGIIGRQAIRTAALAAMVNGGLETFVRCVAPELPRGLRINAVSPTVFEEALDVYGPYFPGFAPVALSDVTRAFTRSIESSQTGQVYELGN